MTDKDFYKESESAEQLYTVYIERYAYGGYGIGKLPGGKLVFVEGTYPGDLAEIEVVTRKI